MEQSSQNRKKKNFASREMPDSCPNSFSRFSKYVYWIIKMLAICGLVYFLVYFYQKYRDNRKFGYVIIGSDNKNQDNDQNIKSCIAKNNP